MQIPFFSFDKMHDPIRGEMIEAFEKVYDSSWFVLGSSVESFERAFGSYIGAKHSIGVANGLDALHLCLRALEIGEGDEVIVPSNTYIASWLAVSYAGATIVPVEPVAGTFNIDADRIEESVSVRTKAIMPVHLFGQAAQMDRIMEIAKTKGLYVVEDNAQAQGAGFKGRKTGTFGHANGTSLYPAKNLGALGDAGICTTDDDELADSLAVLRNYGSGKKYYNEVVGFNSRLDELQAALLEVKLPHLDRWNQMRRDLAALYREGLDGVEEVLLPEEIDGAHCVYHQFVIRTDRRSELQDHLHKKGIGTLIHYPLPPHLQKAYSHLGFEKGDFPIAERLAETSLSLPIYPGLTEGEVDYICGAIRSFFR